MDNSSPVCPHHMSTVLRTIFEFNPAVDLYFKICCLNKETNQKMKETSKDEWHVTSLNLNVHKSLHSKLFVFTVTFIFRAFH